MFLAPPVFILPMYQTNFTRVGGKVSPPMSPSPPDSGAGVRLDQHEVAFEDEQERTICNRPEES